MHRQGTFCFIGLALATLILGLLPVLSSSAAPLSPYPNPLIVISNEGQAGNDVDKTLIQNSVTDPSPSWRGRFFDASEWQDAYPVKRAAAWTTSTDIAPLLNAGADHIWGGAPGPFEDDAGNTTSYPRRYDGSDYANGYAIPASPSPQYLFLRKDFCMPINAQANSQRRLTAGSIVIDLLNATDSAAVPDGPASVWLNGDIIGWIPGDESGHVSRIDIPDPGFLYRGRNALTMRVGDARSDDRAAILYMASFGYTIDPNAIVIGVNTDQPFDGETVHFNVTTDGLSGRSPYGYQWAFGDGDVGTGVSVDHVYHVTSTYTVSLTIADSDACTATAAIPITVLPHPVSIEKTAFPDPVTAGESLRYRLTVHNSSPLRPLTGLVISDVLPAGTTFSACSGGCTPPVFPDRTVRWTLASLGAGASTIFDLYVTVGLTASGRLTNTTYDVHTNEVYTSGVPVSVEVIPPPCLKPLAEVGITGPSFGLVSVVHPFTATVLPSDATEPILYTWTPSPTVSGQGTGAATYRWDIPGVYTLILRAENCGGTLTATHTITIVPRQPSFVYLPLVLRNYPNDAPDNCPGWSLTIATPQEEDFDHPNDRDWYTFQATAGVSYTIRTENLNIRADTVITLYDGTCTTPLIANDDLPYPFNSRASQVGWRAAQTGPLHILVHSYDPDATGPETSYQVVVYDETYPPSPIVDIPDFCDSAHPLAIGEQYSENFDYPNDNDWYTFPAQASRTYTITTSGLGARADTLLMLRSGDCLQLLAENDDLSPSNPASRIVWTATENGQLAVGVRHHDWTIYGADTGYTLTVTMEE